MVIATGATLIIRSAGERTLELCKKLILEQGVPEAQVFVVQEVPFSAAMRKSFEIGISEGRKWTVCVDADVLLKAGSIGHMLAEAEKQSGNVCELQAYVLDKFFGGPREAGFHLYRTSLLNEVIARIPTDEPLRPESDTIKAMIRDGYQVARIHYLLGIHDFEQYYRDIFRKCFVQAHKHLHRAELLISVCKQGMQNDYDYRVGLDGFVAGIYFTRDVSIDASQSYYHEAYNKLEIKEKNKLDDLEEIGLADIESILNSWKEIPIFNKFLPYNTAYFYNRNGNNHIECDPNTNLTNEVKSSNIIINLIRYIWFLIQKKSTSIKAIINKKRI